MITLTAQFTMLAGKESLAIDRATAVRDQADREQPGTLLYMVHRVLDANGGPTLGLLFYECYADDAAYQAHLQSSSWLALKEHWSDCFAGSPQLGQGITVAFLDRLGGFVHLDTP